MKFTGYLALLATVACVGGLAATTGQVHTATAGSLHARTTAVSHIAVTPNEALDELDSVRGRLTKQVYGLSSSLGHQNHKLLIPTLEHHSKRHLASESEAVSKLPADVNSALEKFGKQKQKTIKYLYWVRNVLGYKKHKLFRQLQTQLDSKTAQISAKGGKLSAEADACLTKIGGEKNEVLAWAFWVKNVLGYKKRKLLHDLEDKLLVHGVLQRSLDDVALPAERILNDLEGELQKLDRRDVDELLKSAQHFESMVGTTVKNGFKKVFKRDALNPVSQLVSTASGIVAHPEQLQSIAQNDVGAVEKDVEGVLGQLGKRDEIEEPQVEHLQDLVHNVGATASGNVHKSLEELLGPIEGLVQ